MNVLLIGNSFSVDSTRYLHDIARADGEKLEVFSLYIGGCTLERHYRNMLSEDRSYELQCNGHLTGFFVSMKEALLNRKWDVITLQQASPYSFRPESYQPYLGELAAYVRRCAPCAKLYVHQTWAYEAGSDRLHGLAGFDTPQQMMSEVKKAYAAAAETIGADGIIPSGELLLSLTENGINKVHRDTFHASYGIGRYALGLLWYRTLYGRTVAQNDFCDFDEPISETEIAIIKRCVDQTKV